MMQKLWCKLKKVVTQSDDLSSSSQIEMNDVLKMEYAIQRLNQSQQICLFRTDYLE